MREDRSRALWVTPICWWGAVVLLVLVFFGFVWVSAFFELRGGWTVSGIVAAELFFAVYLLWAGAVVVPQNTVLPALIFGRFWANLGPGLHFVFPLFGIMQVGELIPHPKQVAFAIRMKDGNQEGYGLGNPEFKGGGKASADALVTGVIEDPYRFYFMVEGDTFAVIANRLEAALKQYLRANLTLEEAMAHGNIAVDKVLNVSTSEGSPDRLPLAETLKEYGFRVLSIDLVDIQLAPEESAARDKIYYAKREQEAAEVEKKTARIRAEAEKQAALRLGKGEGQRIKAIAQEAELSPQEAAELRKAQLWSGALEKGGHSVITSAPGLPNAAVGAAVGAGASVGSKVDKKEDK
ncbi:SPFH/Band 7/PHB domain protein [Candidatus Parcubacteria bacterium]|nr:MAG: SPFH/Band 7/PHB domain protein [Candidatus Parcubacteria bacterium]